MIYDISPPADPRLAVFPGDTPLTREVIAAPELGDPVTLSTLHATCHLGAHVDAPLHYDPAGAAIGDRPLEPFVGPCRVVRVEVRPDSLVTVSLVRAALAAESAGDPTDRIGAARILIATGSYRDPGTFQADFSALEPALIEWLAERGVRLVGIDTPSIDPARSKVLPAHAAVLRHDMNILEGIVLEGVPAAIYELIALPLRLSDFDGSPVRAVLRTLPT